MKRILNFAALLAVTGILVSVFLVASCKKEENPIQFEYGTFPDSVLNLNDINSVYDDYNTDCYQLYGELYILFSSNRGSSGGQYDFVQGMLSFAFDQTTGEFGYISDISNVPLLSGLISAANTPGNDFGPYSLFSTVDGYEYLITASENTNGDLDFFYFKNWPSYGLVAPEISGPFPATFLNTSSNEAYISLNTNQDSAYFCSDTDGNYDIYLHTIPEETSITTWLGNDYTSPEKVDSINSTENEKCPIVFRNVMFFVSDRPGGLGGYDLYYSLFKNGKWNSPKNMGPKINSSSDEFRPRLWYHQNFSNYLMLFSSNRPGGLGGFDLYLKGIDLPD